MVSPNHRDHGYAHPKSVAGGCRAVVRIGIECDVNIVVELHIFNGGFLAVNFYPVSRYSKKLELSVEILSHAVVVACSRFDEEPSPVVGA